LPRSRSHYGPTNHRNKPQTIPKQNHEPRSKPLSCPVNTLADTPRHRGGRTAVTGRTVRYPRANGPLNATERSDEHPNARTVYTWSSDSPRATRAAQTVRGLRADGPAHTRVVCDPYADCPTNPFQLETNDQTNQNEDAQEHATNTKNPRTRKLHADCPWPIGGLSARLEQSSPSSKPRAQPLLPVHGSPKQLELLRKDLAKM
jgi:hypothetical protein